MTFRADPASRGALRMATPGAPRPAARAPSLTPRLWLLLIFIGFLWGGSFFFTQVALAHLRPIALVALRIVFAAAALLAYAGLRGVSLKPLAERPLAFLLLSVLNNIVPFTLLSVGQTGIGGGLASVINATTPLWTVLIAAVATSDERMTVNRFVGVLLGLAGVATLVGPQALGFGAAAPAWAVLSIVGATISYAAAAVFAKSFRGTSPVVVTAGQFCVSSILIVPLALTTVGMHGLVPATTAVWAAVLGLALVSTAFGFILYFTIVAEAGATNASLVTFLVPPSAILLGILFMGESLSLTEIGGFALILAGLAAVDGRLFKSRKISQP